jgi:hypothetical protein
MNYRSLGCAPCTKPIQSTTSTVLEIIDELQYTKISERSTRAQDQEIKRRKMHSKGFELVGICEAEIVRQREFKKPPRSGIKPTFVN